MMSFMKKELSSIEIHFLVREFLELANSKISKIYQPDKKEIVFQFFTSGRGKRFLTIRPPNFVYVSEEKKDSKQTPYGFCMTLRKYLENTFLDNVTQVKSERIIDFLFSAKEENYHLIVEMFSKGNVVLCKEDYTIIQALEHQEWKDRVIKPREIYKAPIRKYNLFEISREELHDLMKSSEKGIAATLATSLGLGGVFSEEILCLSNIDKSKKKLSGKEVDLIYDSLKKIVQMQINPVVIRVGGNVTDAFPFPLGICGNLKQEKIGTFSKGIELLPLDAPKVSPAGKKAEKLRRILEEQKAAIERVSLEIEENTKKAETIYNNYGHVKSVLSELLKIREKHSWKEIREKLKDHPTIREIDERDKKVLLRLN